MSDVYEEINNLKLPEGLSIINSESGLILTDGKLELKAEFDSIKKRIKQSNLEHELIVKAMKIKNVNRPITVIDATAGLGEDSYILAAAGFNVKLFEYDPVINLLLRDSIDKAKNVPEIANIASRMEISGHDSILEMKRYSGMADVVYLDPMFPERQKSGLIKKKFQLLQKLEAPCDNAGELIKAAVDIKPKKIVIKRPLKGENLGGIKPDYSYKGKAIRYDVILIH